MGLLELTEFLVKSIIKDPELVSFKQIEDEDQITIEILADESIVGSIIGKKGTIANAIRVIVQSSAYANNLKKVRINISSY